MRWSNSICVMMSHSSSTSVFDESYYYSGPDGQGASSAKMSAEVLPGSSQGSTIRDPVATDERDFLSSVTCVSKAETVAA